MEMSRGLAADRHVPVMLTEILDALAPSLARSGALYVDATLGMGGHTEAILTEDDAAADHFFRQLDSAILIRNASTQFADGGEFGFGAEIGISTQKLHARGPMALAELTTTKWVVEGEGHTR